MPRAICCRPTCRHRRSTPRSTRPTRRSSTLALTSKTLPLTQVEDLADTRMAQKISQQPGVGLVSIGGGQRPAVRIQVNPRALAAYGLNIDDLRTTLGNANVNAPKGNFDGPRAGVHDQRQRPDHQRRRTTTIW